MTFRMDAGPLTAWAVESAGQAGQGQDGVDRGSGGLHRPDYTRTVQRSATPIRL